MINRVGITAVIDNNPPSSLLTPNIEERGTQSVSLGIVSEVILTPDQILNNFTSSLQNNRGVSSLGGVKCSNISEEVIYPLFPNIKTVPLVGELVIILSVNPSAFLPSTDNSFNDPNPNIFVPQSFYISPLNIRGNNFLNTVPNVEIDDKWKNAFDKSLKIHKLIPQIGDTILEGRFGNSIRLSSTIDDFSHLKLPWSENPTEKGNNSDPIIILRNGQDPDIKTTVTDPTLPIEEDINGDLSSLYMTSYQKLPIEISKIENKRFISYSTPPITPSQFSDPQIIGNSDRILLNAKKDSILLSAQKSVGLMTNESINLESPKIHLHSDDLRLGNKDASQSALYGDLTIQNLKSLVNMLRTLVSSTIATDPKYSAQAATFLTTLELIDTQFNNCKSINVKIS